MNRAGQRSTSGGDNLTPVQRQLLQFFSSMSDDAQEFIFRVSENHARVFPRQRPELRLVGGRVAA